MEKSAVRQGGAPNSTKTLKKEIIKPPTHPERADASVCWWHLTVSAFSSAEHHLYTLLILLTLLSPETYECKN